jgi:hypothetical protein
MSVSVKCQVSTLEQSRYYSFGVHSSCTVHPCHLVAFALDNAIPSSLPCSPPSKAKQGKAGKRHTSGS